MERISLISFAENLVCPVTQQSLRIVALEDARARIAGGLRLATRSNASKQLPIGETDSVLLREDETTAYPVRSGVPVLLAPEALRRTPFEIDLSAHQYAEAYLEMEFYNDIGFKQASSLRRTGTLLAAEGSEALQHLERLRHCTSSERQGFPAPRELWLHARMDLQSERECFEHIGSVKGQRVLQLGGSGTTALALLLAGASEGMLLTPMLGEALFAIEAAKIIGLADRFRCFIGVAEEIPLAGESVDVAFSHGCVHHMRTEIAFPAIARVLRPRGRFAAMEPWRAPLYRIGTAVLGKRDPNPFCHPMTRARVAPLFDAFREARYELHGTLTRYPMIGLQKFGIPTPLERAWSIGRADDRVSSMLGLRRFGSGVALLACK
jgi:uncharacterized protein YbaR (Trm112 family)/ubiquinone/menaquinone biosynthesis C-methylase UbiE